MYLRECIIFVQVDSEDLGSPSCYFPCFWPMPDKYTQAIQRIPQFNPLWEAGTILDMLKNKHMGWAIRCEFYMVSE